MADDAPLLLSFFTRGEDNARLKAIVRVAEGQTIPVFEGVV